MDKTIKIKIKTTSTQFAIDFPKKSIIELQPLGIGSVHTSFYADGEGNLYELTFGTTFRNKSDAEAVLNNVLNSEIELEEVDQYSKICMSINNNYKDYSTHYRFIHIYEDSKEFQTAKELLSISSVLVLKAKELPNILLERLLKEIGFGYEAGHQFFKWPSKISA